MQKHRDELLKNYLIHNTFISKTAYLNKLDRYAKWQARDYDKSIKKVTAFHCILKPVIRFIKHYFIQFGILDGYVGLIISLYQAKAVRMRYTYLKQYKKKCNSIIW